MRYESKLKSYSRLAILPVLFALVALGSFASVNRQAEAQIPGDLSVSKTATASVLPGGTITYTVTIANVGLGPRELINFTDTIPANTTYVAGSWVQNTGPTFTTATVGAPVTSVTASRVLALNAGESAVFTFRVTVNAGAVGPILNVAATCVVSSTSTAFPETNLTNNNCSASTIITPFTPTPVPSTPVPATPIPPTPIPAPPLIIPQVIQNPAVGGIFNGSRNDTPTPVRPSAIAPIVIDPGGIPVLRPPSTGESGLADNGPSNVVYGLAIIAALGVVSFGAARLRTVRNRK